MIKFRILESPSGEYFKVQQYEASFRSRFIHFFLPRYPLNMVWKTITGNDTFFEDKIFFTKEQALNFIQKRKQIILDETESWTEC